MLRALSILAVGLIFLASSATSQTPPFFDKKTDHRQVQQKTTQQADSVIPNFTGHWTGSCQGQSQLFSITIDQGYTTLKITDDSGFNGEYELGGVSHQTTITNYGDNRFSQSAVFWNPYSHILSLNTVITHMATNSIFPMSTDIFALNFSLEQDQLTVEGDAHFFDGTEESEASEHRTCTLSKTQKAH